MRDVSVCTEGGHVLGAEVVVGGIDFNRFKRPVKAGNVCCVSEVGVSG